MSVKKKVVEIDTGTAQKSVKSLRTELKSLKDELVNLEKGTVEYNQVLQQAANIQHDLREMNQELAASAMDFGQIMGNTTATINGVVSGFQALSASMSLLGIENEDTLKTIKKLQAMMALTQGIAGIENGIKAFKRLSLAITNSATITNLFNKATKTTAVTEEASTIATKGLQGAMVGEAAATGTATVATNTFKKALISTGIGAIVVAIGMLIAHLEDLAKWFGICGREAEAGAEKLKKWDSELNKLQQSTGYYSATLEEMQYRYDKEIDAMDDMIEKMKAEGKSEAEIAAQRDKNNARLKEIIDEEVAAIDKSETKIEEYFKKAKNYNISMNNVYQEKLTYQQMIIKNEEIIKKLEAGEKVAGYSKNSVEYLKGSNEELKKEIDYMDQYIGLNKQEDSLNRKAAESERKAQSERTAAAKKRAEEAKKRAEEAKKAAEKRREELKKLREDYEKFYNQLLIDTKTEKDKELETLNQAEKEKLAKLKEYHDKGIINAAKYNEQRTAILEIYAKKRNEVEYKYAEQASKKREEILKKQYDLEKQEADRRYSLVEAQLEQEQLDNLNALNKREISIVDYYNREKEITAQKYDEQRRLLEEDFKNQTNLISAQINERYELLAQHGITEEQRSNLLSEISEMSQQLLNIEAEHNIALQDLMNETNTIIAENTQSIIEEEMNSLRVLTENVTAAMNSITSVGEGISSEWANAFNTMSNGLVDLGQKIKEGAVQWQDYGQMAVAAFSAAGSIMNALADQQDAQTKEGFEQQKKYQVAATTMNMLGGITSAWVSAMDPANAWMTIWGQLAMGTAMSAMILTTGLLQIQKIKQQQFNGGGSSASPSSGAMGNIIAPVQYTQDVQGAEIEGAIKDSRVYVTEADITNTQNKVNVTESEARY